MAAMLKDGFFIYLKPPGGVLHTSCIKDSLRGFYCWDTIGFPTWVFGWPVFQARVRQRKLQSQVRQRRARHKVSSPLRPPPRPHRRRRPLPPRLKARRLGHIGRTWTYFSDLDS